MFQEQNEQGHADSGINTLISDIDEAANDNEQLRAVWAMHLVNEQKRITDEFSKRHPLEHAMKSVLTPQPGDDQSINNFVNQHLIDLSN